MSLEERVKEIEKRNKRVELDKKWETSFVRIGFIVVITYIFATLYLKLADTTNPFLGSVVPCMGFIISTLSLKQIKKFWIKKQERK